jgi:ATP-binding cassette subfamily F protein 3
MALNEFEGSVMLVSHDRALLRTRVCDEFWLVVDGGVEELDADLDEYQRWLLQVSRARARRRAPARLAASPRWPCPSFPPRAAARPGCTPPIAGKRRDERRCRHSRAHNWPTARDRCEWKSSRSTAAWKAR